MPGLSAHHTDPATNTYPEQAGSTRAAAGQRLGNYIVHNWIVLFAVIFGLYVFLPFLSPVFMRLGWNGGGQAIQMLYSTQCHQLPDRSFFLFGRQVTYTLPEIQSAWSNTSDPNVLRQFVGNPQMGWKVAWSDRMVAMYTSTWIFGLLWWLFRKQIRPLPLWGLALFWLPMAVDGGTHLISDYMAGASAGFRYDNAWLATLTNHALPDWFYVGNALGSFNSWMRLVTGLLFGIGLVWCVFPMIEASLGYPRRAAQPAIKQTPPIERGGV